MGVDIRDPVQVNAADINSGRLRVEFGDDPVFWREIDALIVYPDEVPQEVGDEVKRRMEDFVPGGWFVFYTVHSIQLDVLIENLLAIFEAFKEYSKY